MIKQKTFLIFFFILSTRTYASCGLKGCPLVQPMGWSAELNGLLGSVDVSGTSTSYALTTFKIGLAPLSWFNLTAFIPFGSVDMNGNSEFGLSDVVTEAQGRLYEFSSSELWLAFQMEFPTGDEDKLLGAGHYGALPYVTYKYHYKPMMFYGQT